MESDFYRLIIGLLVPDQNIVMEYELHRMAPDGIGIFTARVVHVGRKPQDSFYKSVGQLAKDIPDAVKRIKSVKPNIIAYGCTSGSFLEGESWNRGLIEKMQSIGGARAITASSAVEEALKIMRLNRIAVGTPYPEDVNKKLTEYLSDLGIHVVRMSSIPYKEAQSESAADGLIRGLDGDDIEGIFISCTDFRTIHVLDKLEKELGKPVISSNQATLWSCLRLGGIKDKLKGYGSLLLS